MPYCHAPLGRLRTLLVALATTLTTAACYRQEDAGVATPTRLRIGVLPIVEVGPLYIGLEKGLFEQEQLQVELVRMSGGATILPAVGTGDLDLGFSNVVSVLVFTHERPDLRFQIIGGGTFETSSHRNHALVTQDSSLTPTARDLKGKRFAINTRNNVEELMLMRFLKGLGLQARDIRLRAVPFPAMEGALRSGDIDVASLVEPFISQSVANDMHIVATQYLQQPIDTILVAAYVATETWIEKNGPALERFRRAFARATAFLTDPLHESEVRSILAKHTGIPPHVAQRMGLPLMLSCISARALQMLTTEAKTGQMLPDTVRTDAILAVGTEMCP